VEGRSKSRQPSEDKAGRVGASAEVSGDK
jgi:hypothetical protein